MNPRSAPAEVRVPALDGLRGVAILLVLGLHLWVLAPQGRLETGLDRLRGVGFAGVDLFFVLSGFLITGILMRTKEGPGYFRNFYARRVVRIFPLYYLLVGLTLLTSLMPALLPDTVASSRGAVRLAAGWPWYLLFASNLMGPLAKLPVHPFLGVTWSLAIEEQFYLVWPLVVWLAPRGSLRWLCVGVIAAATATRLGCCLAGCSWGVIYAFPVCRLDALALGALIAVRYRPGIAPSARVVGAARAGWAVGMAGLMALFLTSTGPAFLATAKGQLYYPLAALASGCSLLLALASSGGWLGRLLSSRVLTFFGKYSFAIYLLHPIVSRYLHPVIDNAWIRTLPVPGLVGQALSILVNLAIVAPLAMLSWRLIEAPCLTLKKYFSYAAPAEGDAARAPSRPARRAA